MSGRGVEYWSGDETTCLAGGSSIGLGMRLHDWQGSSGLGMRLHVWQGGRVLVWGRDYMYLCLCVQDYVISLATKSYWKFASQAN